MRAGPYLAMIRAQARGQAQYRGSFAVDAAGTAVFGVLDLVTVVVMLRTAGRLGTFDLRQTFLIASLAAVSFALGDAVVGNIERTRLYVRTGLLDAVLVRPLGSLGQLIALDLSVRRLGRVVTTVLGLGLAAGTAGVHWTPGRIVLFLVAPVAGAVIFGAILVTTSTMAFWWVESGEFANAFVYGGRDFSAYPLGVYGGVLRRVFGYGLGLAFTGYYPALALLGRPDPLGAPAVLGWLSPVVAVVAAAVAALAWRAAIRRYRSTGS